MDLASVTRLNPSVDMGDQQMGCSLHSSLPSPFIILRQIEFLTNLEQLRFTGQLVQTAAGQQATFYLAQGRIVYAMGGLHPIRRWRRNLLTYCPGLPTYRLAWQVDLAKVTDEDMSVGWEYALLKLWVTQQRITQTQAQQVIQSTVTEILSDLIQVPPGTEQIQRSKTRAVFFESLEIETVVTNAKLWQQRWQQAGLNTYSPNQAPVIKQLEQFRHWSSAHSCQGLVRLLNGQRTLRDLAIDLRRDPVDVAHLILHCIHLKFIELISIADLPGLAFRHEPPQTSSLQASSKPLIACIDDSLMVRKIMEDLLPSARYQFLGIEDPLRAIGIVLARKPDFIFLDLLMPSVNGYELCEKLRKLSCFRHTPIVILTGSDGYANRLRSNFVGATDFLSKPLNAEAVLGIIDKHLASSGC